MSKRVTPEQLAASGSEHAHQSALFCWLAIHAPQIYELTFAIPNGGARAESKRGAMIRGAYMKAEGVKPGVPDIMVALPLHNIAGEGWHAGLFIEMKKVKGGVVSDEQSDWRRILESRTYVVKTCFNWHEAVNAIAVYCGKEPPFADASRGH